MDNLTLGVVEARFADLIWEHEPLPSGELVKICERELHWKKPTTYNVLRKLCEKGLFQNHYGTVSALMSRADFYAAKSVQFVSDTYGGSLPAFVAAFTAHKRISKEEAEEIQRMIDAAREGR